MSDYLPTEVILEILRRLPVKSVVRCRSVCRAWNSLINNPSFISTHLQTSLSKPNSPLLLLRLLKDNKENYLLHFDNDDFDAFKQLHSPFEDCLPRSIVVGSCIGLVCLCFFPQDNFLDLFLWNPSVHKYITLPKPSITCLGDNTNLVFGFGFDSRTNDYKLLIVAGTVETLTDAYLFSLSGNCWKRFSAMFTEYAIEGVISSTFVNGAVHWLGYQRGNDGGFRNTVLGFDISTEEYLVMGLPESLIGLCPLDLSIMKYQEASIAVLRRDWEDSEQLDMWVMKEYGKVGSWTKVLHLTDQSGGLPPRVLGFRKNGEVLLQVDGGEMASMDLNCQQIEHLGIEAKASFVDSYVESLVLLDKGVDSSSVNDANLASDSRDSDSSESEFT
ncbi:hypothetical protein PTKIN_Ptkin11bG0155700 [Pterospermum kingtungense]